ncbi:ATP-dependent DNA helicase [Spiroplasma sp. TIUS-1]|uniref:ATP-dependent helicase n=1 Tax=Spiroplasma sp. TIUS-1 TaxID=216963 RepID=UPI00139847AF|nr:UvrD-helicase domain-containing protein [Spiroplasma sp. TIUS-1]QHX35646.1 ATP-dependent DNA helicase [Spiroplasma sp. TIUS-1]
MSKLNDLIKSLNDEQVDALLELNRPLRILAGAGSGKTRVITGKIGHLIENEGIHPSRILALTFTNKAANEMKERIHNLIGTTPRFITTFHSFGVRVLREEFMSVGLTSAFQIVDTSDQSTIIKRLIKENNIDSKLKDKEVIGYISRWKNQRLEISPNNSTNYKEIQIAKVYNLYLRYMKDNDSIDFDDLILKVEDLFISNKDVLIKWSQKFEYILVDEFQDTSTSQYHIVKLLLANRGCLTVVGDPDQNIYSWRGSELNIILDFEKNFKNARTVFLNKNYRSTQKILDVANDFIDKNKMREKKDIYSDTKSGASVHVKEAASQPFEAKYVSNKINELVNKKGYKYSDFFILYRNHAISRPFETSFQNEKIPFEIYGGMAFRDRAVVKDLSSMIKMMTHGNLIAFNRVFKHVPKIGAVTVEKIFSLAKSKDKTVLSLFLEDFDELQLISKNLESFKNILITAKSEIDSNEKPVKILQGIVSGLGYELQFNSKSREDEEAKANILTFYDQLESYIELTDGEITNTHELFISFLQNEAIDVTNAETDENPNKVVMSTVHGAKGLERRVVFIVGVNNNVFPSRFSKISVNALEEERRLFYVAITRAKEELYIMYSVGTFSHLAGEVLSTSRFLEEIDSKLYELESNIFYHSSSEMSSKIIIPTVEQKQINTSSKEVVKGDIVEHAAFGLGVVISIQGKFISIAFSDPKYKTKMIPLNSNVWWKSN